MKTVIVQKSNREITGMAGTKLVEDVLRKGGAFVDAPVTVGGARGPKPTYTNRNILTVATASLAAGNPDYIDVEQFASAPEYYGAFLGAGPKCSLPSEASVRLRLGKLGDEMAKAEFSPLQSGNIRMLKRFGVIPQRLFTGQVPVDIDVTTFDNSDTKREGVSHTYMEYDGFAPIMSYIGAQGIGLNCEFRPGKQHCQNGTPAFIANSLRMAKELTSDPLLFRLDSGNDAKANMELLIDDPQASFLIKRNFRRLNRTNMALHLMQTCTHVEEPRPGKKVYIGSTTRPFAYRKAKKMKLSENEIWKKCFTVRLVYEITERITDPFGQLLMIPTIDIDMYYTDLPESMVSDADIIELYHSHGTSEQFHSEIKTDLNLVRFPSHKFNTNALFLKLALLAFNALKIIEGIAQEMPRTAPIHFKNTTRRRIRTIIENLIRIPGLLSTHARRKTLSLARSTPWADVFLYVNSRLQAA